MSALRLSPGASVLVTAAGVVIRSDLATYRIGGADAAAFVARLLPLLDGTRDLAAVSAALPEVSAAGVARAIDMLRARGLLDEGGWWAAAGKVAVTGQARWVDAAAAALAASGVEVRWGDPDRDTALLVAAGRPDEEAEIERLSAVAQRVGARSLWGHLAGTRSMLGPLVTPGETACRVCAGAEGLNPRWPSGGVAPGEIEDLFGHLVAMAALEALAALPARLAGRVMEGDLAGHRSTLHTLTRLPWCRVCSAAAITSAPRGGGDGVGCARGLLSRIPADRGR